MGREGASCNFWPGTEGAGARSLGKSEQPQLTCLPIGPSDGSPKRLWVPVRVGSPEGAGCYSHQILAVESSEVGSKNVIPLRYFLKSKSFWRGKVRGLKDKVFLVHSWLMKKTARRQPGLLKMQSLEIPCTAGQNLPSILIWGNLFLKFCRHRAAGLSSPNMPQNCSLSGQAVSCWNAAEGADNVT